jgi:S-DNA-T family DNA segregation ATPase FtsK/SpoIIIE
MGARLFSPPSARANPPESLVSQGGSTSGRGKEAAALLLFAAAIYLVLALLSLRVDPHDPNVVGGNWVGPVGAAVAKLLVMGFGVVAWAVPLELICVGAPLFRRKRVRFPGLRLAGDLVVGIVAAALVQVAAPRTVAFGRAPSGGNVGVLFGELLQALFSTAGSFLVGGTIIGLILIGRSSFSFIDFSRATIVALERFGTRLWQLGSRMAEAWRSARAIRKDESTRERPAPKIDARSDEAIIAELNQDSEWEPLKNTGAPPLALADSLREQLSDTDEHKASPLKLTREGADEDPAAVASKGAAPNADQPEQCSAPAEPEPAAAEPAAQQSPSDGLTIVDTRHLAQVDRAPKARARKKGFTLPDTELLETQSGEVVSIDKERVVRLADKLEKTLADYGVSGTVEEVHPGPTVTTYEVAPAAGTKVSKVAGLSDDLALGLSRKVRIIAPIPGKARIGFELPNDERVPVNLRELVEDRRFKKLAERAALPVVLGRDIVGAPFYADLAAMPHVIVAGATGAGKSVGLNVMLSSLLFKRTPDELRLLMIDPKVVELAPFDGIPHMLLPVVTDMRQAAKALKWAVDEMEKRYQAFAIAGTKNISTYNRWATRVQKGELPLPEPEEVVALTADGCPVSVPAAQVGGDGTAMPGKMPHIVVVVDEFADLMMQQGKEVEASVARLAQKARAAGMHVVLATQRPSVNVITGMIKANFPTRIAYRVAQKVDSGTIIDEKGAELLLGKGDMLVKLNGSTDTHRVQCPFVSEEEVDRLTAYLRSQGTPIYHDDILKADEDEETTDADTTDLDPRFDEAVRIVADTQRCSTSWLQRKMTIGYNRAAKIVEAMEAQGMIGPPNGSKEREIFVKPQ